MTFSWGRADRIGGIQARGGGDGGDGQGLIVVRRCCEGKVRRLRLEQLGMEHSRRVVVDTMQGDEASGAGRAELCLEKK